MNMTTKHEVLKDHLLEWLEAKNDRKKRGQIVKMVCAAIRIHPKSVPRAFTRIRLRGMDPRRRRGRPRKHAPNVIAALKDVWEAADQCCAELLHPVVLEYVTIFKRDGQWRHCGETTEQLTVMTLGTMKRRVGALTVKYGRRRHGMSSTKPSSLKSIIPIFKGPWKDVLPGTGQIDTVAHCGDSLSGDLVFTVNYTDAATYWIIPAAQWNKGQMATADSLKSIRDKLPFPMRMLHPDTGGEFINMNLKTWCDKEDIKLSRSEPGKKNDNMYVEERNGHVVRRYLGYVRYDVPETVPVINELYDSLSIYLNHFKAVRRQVTKERVGVKYVRRYESVAKTPYERVMEHPSVLQEAKQRLLAQHSTLNPLNLKLQIDTLVMRAYKLQKSTRNRK